ncbi:hypothetical protein ACFL60_04950 [Candidatus Omnitrophota bacterium]
MERRSFIQKTGTGLLAPLLACGCSGKRDTGDEGFLDTTPTSGTNARQAVEKEFQVYESLLYGSKSDFQQVGLKHVEIIYSGQLWQQGADRTEPDEALVRSAAKNIADTGNPVVIDIEHWQLTGDEDVVSANIEKYISVVDWMNEERPELVFGYYGTLPVRNYWAPVGNNGMDEWQGQNERLMTLGEHVEAVFPSIYVFYEDQGGWETYAKANIQEARRYGKPVYPFIWPEYHPSNAQLTGTDVSGKYWRRQLDICRQYADGFVIWGGWKRTWDDNAPWWTATQHFLSEQSGPSSVKE